MKVEKLTVKECLGKKFKLVYLSSSIAEWPRFSTVLQRLAFFTYFPLLLIGFVESGKLCRINSFFFKGLKSKRSGEANQQRALSGGQGI